MKTKSFKQYTKEQTKEPTGKLKDACWKGYTAIGMKKKNGKTVPNCVPKESVELEEKYILPDAVDEYLERLVNPKKYKTAVRAYLNWRRKNPGRNTEGIDKFARMTGISTKNLRVTMQKMIDKGILPKHLSVEVQR